MGKGTSSLFTEVVSGAMSSTVSFVGTASKGISYLSGDIDFIRKRENKQSRHRATKGGFFEGILDGGESVVHGITSGVTGLVTKPIREAQRNGVEGFFRGVGMGLLGAAVKPVLGITDGITSVASGIHNSVTAGSENSVDSNLNLRPLRALDRCVTDSSILVVVPYNLEAALAQDFVIKRAKMNKYDDSYISYIPLNSNSAATSANSSTGRQTIGESIILSDIYFFWKRSHNLWGRTWSNISHCILTSFSVCVVLYGGSNGSIEYVQIPCAKTSVAIRVYRALEQNASRVGNPTMFLPVDIAIQECSKLTDMVIFNAAVNTDSSSMNSTAIYSTRTYQKNILNTSLNLFGEIENYRFGDINNMHIRGIVGSEDDVLIRARAKFVTDPVTISSTGTSGGMNKWKQLDMIIRNIIFEWECTHKGSYTSRCSATLIVNLSERVIQLSRIQLLLGKSFMVFGSKATGYHNRTRLLASGGYCVVFIWANTPSALDVGHFKAKIYSSSFSLTVASTQRETYADRKGGFYISFLEKTVTNNWCKYVTIIHS